MTDTELKIWAAGAFDGEGSALIERNGPNSFQIVVAVVNTDYRLVDPFLSTWGGRLITRPAGRFVRDGSPRRETYELWFSELEAKELLMDLLPHLRSRRESAALILRAIMLHQREIASHGKRGSSAVLESLYQEGIKHGYWGTRRKPRTTKVTPR